MGRGIWRRKEKYKEVEGEKKEKGEDGTKEKRMERRMKRRKKEKNNEWRKNKIERNNGKVEEMENRMIEG